MKTNDISCGEDDKDPVIEAARWLRDRFIGPAPSPGSLSLATTLASVAAALTGVGLIIGAALLVDGRLTTGVGVFGGSLTCGSLLLWLMRRRAYGISTCLLSMAGPAALAACIGVYLWSQK
jgi:hypothetical protein